ncbi:MAG: sulfatase-like hydrolase/transferase, partial [Actinobacteria bacterium]|nr:sulfatase-like hydrolase/transferase [Actinomycetota bacterium]
MNVLFITLDQFRGDCLGAAGHPLVQTPALDLLAAAGVRLARHYSQAAPCGPGRACLYTGTYQLNNRVVANGTPLDARFDNVAKAAVRAGYQPALFGYTDQSIDPRESTGPDDPRMQHYSGVLPGFTPVLHIPDDHQVWLDWLATKGYTDLGDGYAELAREPQRPAEHSVSAFLTDHALDWLRSRSRDEPWFAHLSYLRPHPPRTAAGPFAEMYDPADVDLPIAPAADRHPFHSAAMHHAESRAPTDEAKQRRMRAQYYGMISEVDSQLARLWDAMRELDMWDDTMIVVTADHGDQLGDHGLTGKLGWFEQSYSILGIVRHPGHPQAHGSVVDHFTENVDLFPTMCEAMGVPVPVQCDGVPLTPFLRGETPPWWRTAAHWEFDWRDRYIDSGPHEWPWDRRLERQHVATIRDAEGAYAQFGDGSWLSFDLVADPTWRTPITDPARV